jgi:hypothetical protein
MHVNEIQAWRGAPMSENQGLHMLAAEWGSQQGIFTQIQLTNCQIVCRPPISVEKANFFGR